MAAFNVTLSPTGGQGSIAQGYPVPAQAVSGANYVGVARIINPSRRGTLTITGQVTGAALTGLSLTAAGYPGGVHAVLLQDADFNTPTTALLLRGTNNAHLTAANGAFQIVLNMDGIGELVLLAKSGGSANVSLDIGH